MHGTTVVINAITERRGARVGLITTEGFRDVLEIARGDRPDFFNLLYRKPPPFVPRYLRREVPGRMTYRGEERSPLNT
ncbi:hydantoinase/oxoprolinase family protein, partial [Shewanella sp. C31]|nr:hydantoinase/oxoprolinase family protein [Shewanella electrica]